MNRSRPHRSVAVNLSPTQSGNGRMVATVASTLAASGLDPRRFEPEIADGLLLNDNVADVATLHALHDLGVRVAMDDFGTACSSLSCLRSFLFDTITIDHAFVSGGPSAGFGRPWRSCAPWRAGAAPGTATVADRVETAERGRLC